MVFLSISFSIVQRSKPAFWTGGKTSALRMERGEVTTTVGFPSRWRISFFLCNRGTGRERERMIRGSDTYFILNKWDCIIYLGIWCGRNLFFGEANNITKTWQWIWLRFQLVSVQQSGRRTKQTNKKNKKKTSSRRIQRSVIFSSFFFVGFAGTVGRQNLAHRSAVMRVRPWLKYGFSVQQWNCNCSDEWDNFSRCNEIGWARAVNREMIS